MASTTTTTLHSYPFYIADWRTSETVTSMTAEERDCYRNLLDANWMHGDLPADEDALLPLSLQREKVFQKTWPKVKHLFPPTDSGRLCNPKVAAKRPDILKQKVKQREGAKKTNESRSGPAERHAKRDAKRSGDRDANRDGERSVLPSSCFPLPESTTDHSGFGSVVDSARSAPENPPKTQEDGWEVDQVQRLLSSTLARMAGGEEAHRRLGYPDESIARQCLAACGNRVEKIPVILLDLRDRKAPDSWGWFPKVLRERAPLEKT